MKKIVTALLIVIVTISFGCSQNSDQDNNNIISEQKQNDIENHKQKNEQMDTIRSSRLAESITVDSDGNNIVTNPDDLLVVSNKERYLPDGYEPQDLVIPNVPFPFEEKNEKKFMRKEAAKALEEMFADAKANNLNLYAQSGYRSYERQKTVFASNVKRLGEEDAKRVSASPGQSEHQTGLAMDVTSPEVNFKLIVEFEQTPEGKWVLEHAHHYGFIIRYPKGKEAITGYDYEPWHLRYVGKEHAKYIKENELTLEEYLSESTPVYNEKS